MRPPRLPGPFCAARTPMKTPLLKSGLALVTVVRCLQPATGEDLHSFQRLQLNDQFWCEGANFGDLNHDGKDDVISGPWWYEGPDFQKRHESYPATTTFSLKLGPLTTVTVPGFEDGLGVANRYSDNFFVWTPDLDRDGWNDILVIVTDARLRLQWRRAEQHIVVGNKKGTFVLLRGKKTVSPAEWDKAQPKPLAR